ncbi:hypothetical protein DL98DRAFT_120388 [Cadophora sp. DSE1049]|nr:hypothetical protein DL98DRAFT_120388 [Cadophora sp. DSE1049]
MVDIDLIVALATIAFFIILAGLLIPLGLFIIYYCVIDLRIMSRIVSRVYSIGGTIVNRFNFRVYENLDLTALSSQIRLVHILPGPVGSKIKCKLVLGDWKTSSYEALSYVWGNTVLVQPIELNGRLFLITGNLHTALEGLRDEFQERVVWIDALSINQRDYMEREHQVQQMRQIYANASSVQVSLGEGHPYIDSAFKNVRALIESPSDGTLSSSGYFLRYARTKNVFRELLRHDWWERIWVVQEVAVAKRIDIFCGSSTIPWGWFRDFITQRHVQPEPEDTFGHAMFKFLSRGLSVLQTSPVLEYGLLDLAHEFRSRHASNPRDKLYALLGLLSNSEDRGVIPDYTKAVDDVYMDFVKSHIAQYNSLAILSFAEYRDPQPVSLPSWCPNWTVQSLYPTPFWKKSTADLDMWLHESRDYYYASGNSIPILAPHSSPKILGLRGFVFDRIMAIGSEATLPYEYRTRESDEVDWSQASWPTYRFSSRPRVRRTGPVRNKTLAQWGWEELALGPWSSRISQFSPYPREPGRSNAYYHTITAGVLGDRNIDWSFMRNDALFEAGDFLGKREVCRSVDLACLGRKFFVTRRGFMGLAPTSAQEGDLVTILFGGNIPFILRSEGQHYRMLGQTYVHGVMAYDDEEMERDIKMRRVDVEDFLII